jgi:predicted phosphoribosyltransferase
MSCAHLPYRDRREAGQVLAEHLAHLQGHEDLLVLALPRGGVAVGFEVARALHAIGAIASGGVQVINEAHGVDISERQLQEIAARERKELERREWMYRDGRQPVEAEGRTVIVVDDGLATGATMRAAVAALRRLNPERLVVAVPVGAAETCERLRHEADEVVCAAMPYPFRAVGLWYRDFPQASDEEVRELLAAAEAEHAQPAH